MLASTIKLYRGSSAWLGKGKGEWGKEGCTLHEHVANMAATCHMLAALPLHPIASFLLTKPQIIII